MIKTVKKIICSEIDCIQKDNKEFASPRTNIFLKLLSFLAMFNSEFIRQSSLLVINQADSAMDLEDYEKKLEAFKRTSEENKLIIDDYILNKKIVLIPRSTRRQAWQTRDILIDLTGYLSKLKHQTIGFKQVQVETECPCTML